MRHATRRDALMLIATAASLPAGAPAFAAAQESGLVPRTPMDVYAKIRCSLRDEPVPFWYRAHSADVNDPALASAPCTFHLQELASIPRGSGAASKAHGIETRFIAPPGMRRPTRWHGGTFTYRRSDSVRLTWPPDNGSHAAVR